MRTFAFHSADDREKRLIFQDPEAPKPTPANPETKTEAIPAIQSQQDVQNIVRSASNSASQDAQEMRSVLVREPQSFWTSLSSLFSGDFWQNLFKAFGVQNSNAAQSNRTQAPAEDVHTHPAGCGCGQHSPERAHAPDACAPNPCTPPNAMQLLNRYCLSADVTKDNFAAGIEHLSDEELESALFQVKNDMTNKENEYKRINYNWDRRYAEHKRATRYQRGKRISQYNYMAGRRAETNQVKNKYGDLDKLYWALINERGNRQAGQRVTGKESRQMWRDHLTELSTDQRNMDGESVRAQVLRNRHEELHRYDGFARMAEERKAEEAAATERHIAYIRKNGFPQTWTRESKQKFYEKYGDPFISQNGEEAQSDNFQSDISPARNIQRRAADHGMKNYVDTTGKDAQDAARLDRHYTTVALRETANLVMNKMREIAQNKKISFRVLNDANQRGDSWLIQLVPATGSEVAMSSIRLKMTEEGRQIYEVIDYAKKGVTGLGTVNQYQTIDDAVQAAVSLTQP